MIRTSVAVECDVCGTRRHRRVPNGRPARYAIGGLRAALATLGWTTLDGGADVCPRCPR